MEYRFDVRARSFLHHQVRSFVGTLARVGEGAWSPDRVKTALEACDRAQCGPVCPPAPQAGYIWRKFVMGKRFLGMYN